MTRDREFETSLERAKEFLGLRRMHRRDMIRFVGGASGLAALNVYISACSNQPPAAPTKPAAGATSAPSATSAQVGAPPTAAAQPTVAAEPPKPAVATAAPSGQGVPGGALTIGYDAEPDSLNAYTTRLFAATESGIHEGLIVTNDKMEYVPAQAESVPTLENGGVQLDPMRVTYKLRPDLKWSDGQPLTSDDVKFTWQTIINPDFKRGGFNFSEGYDLIEKVDTPDPRTAILTFKANYAAFNGMFRALLPKHVLDGKDVNTDPFNRIPISNGPMRVKDWVSGQYSQMERNPFYRTSGRPYLDGMTMKFLTNTNTRIGQLQTGEAQYINQVPWDRMDEIAKFPGVAIQSLVVNSWEHLDFNFRNPSLQDLAVRQAVAMAIDKKSIAEKVLQGKVPVADNVVTPLSWAHNPNVMKWEFNPEKAKQTLEDAGWKVGSDGIREKGGQKLSFDCVTYAGDTLRERVQQVIQAQVKAIGIDFRVQNYPPNTFFELVNDGKFDIKIHRWISSAEPGFASFFASNRMPPKGLNNVFWSNDEVSKVFDDADREVDQNKRKELLWRAQDILVRELPTIPLFYRPNVIAATAKLKDVKMNPTNDGDMWALGDWYLEK